MAKLPKSPVADALSTEVDEVIERRDLSAIAWEATKQGEGRTSTIEGRRTSLTTSAVARERAARARFRLPSIDLNAGFFSMAMLKNKSKSFSKGEHLDTQTGSEKRTGMTQHLPCSICGQPVQPAALSVRRCEPIALNNELESPRIRTASRRGMIPLPHIGSTSDRHGTRLLWQPGGQKVGFSEGQCVHCGLVFDKFSIANHDKWCKQFPKEKKDWVNPITTDNRRGGGGGGGGEKKGGEKLSSDIVARVVTLGLTPGQYETVYLRSSATNSVRPKTRSLPYSSLQRTGYGIPSNSVEEASSNNGFMRCGECSKVIACDRLEPHFRMCRGKSGIVSQNSVSCAPISGHGEKSNPSPQQQWQHSSRTQNGPKQRFIVCYICGREYGSLSIAIHEPQCLQKFNIENSKLPIHQRKPLPKKPPQKSGIAHVVFREDGLDERRIVERPADLVDHVVQDYFSHCYSEFEKGLVPCRKCGRTFAPDRHRLHEPNCRAKSTNRSEHL